MTNDNWTLMASHGCVLFYVALNPEATIREIAAAVELTDRRVSQIVRDLARSDMLSVERRGRRNIYRVNPHARFPEPLSSVPLGEFISLLEDPPQGVSEPVGAGRR